MSTINFRGKSYNARKEYWYGTQRTVSPQETLERIRPHFKAVGLTRLSNITGLDRIGIPTTLAIRPNSPTLSNSSGKGFTLEAAMVSGAMEAIEMYHAENISLPHFRLPYDQLDGDYEVIPIEHLPLIKHSLFHVSWPYYWVLGWNLLNQREVAVPISVIDMVRNRKRSLDIPSFQVSSNGLASGNDFLEAVSSGLFEVIERDAITCQRVAWEGYGLAPPLVRLESIEHPLVLELLDRFKVAQVAPLIFDCTMDTDVPVYMAYIYDRASRHVGIFRGYGAHLDPEIAMIRALTEAVQSRLVYIAGSRDDFFRHNYMRMKISDSREAIRAIQAMIPTVDARDRKSQATPTFEDDIHMALEKLRRVGLNQVIVFELTQPGFPIRVVKVVVPGLEGYMFDFYTPGHRAKTFCKGKRA